MPDRVLVTGYRGFIGHHVVCALIRAGHAVVGLDKGTYAAHNGIQEMPGLTHENFWGVEGDVAQMGNLGEFDTVIHLAAETHVDNSLTDPVTFLRENTVATVALLEWLRGHPAHERPLLLHISTDEVYGDGHSLPSEVIEDVAFEPSSPYAASKAAAEHFIRAYGRTYGLRYRIVRPANCYGEWQYREKLIPKTIRRLLWGKPAIIHGDGKQTRSWLHVKDCADAILTVMDKGKDSEAYNIEGPNCLSVNAVVTHLVDVCIQRGNYGHWISVTRPGMDMHYGMNSAKITQLGWVPTKRFSEELPTLVDWYMKRLAPPTSLH